MLYRICKRSKLPGETDQVHRALPAGRPARLLLAPAGTGMAYHKVRKTPPPPVELLLPESEATGEAQAAEESV
jgi:hypothetical protein